MSGVEFYKDKSVTQTEWWLSVCDLPELRWGRLRVFNDGTADSCFGEGDKLYGFENRSYASYFLSEDEYISFDAIDKEDEKEYGVKVEGITRPDWPDKQKQEFEYLGTY
jgi:hypothetical protein